MSESSSILRRLQKIEQMIRVLVTKASGDGGHTHTFSVANDRVLFMSSGVISGTPGLTFELATNTLTTSLFSAADGTISSLTTDEVRIDDTSTAFYTILVANSGSSQTANRYLTFDLADANVTLTINASSALNQNVLTTSTPTFAGADVSSGTLTAGTFAGAIDAGGATSFEIPNGAGGTTVNATGEVTIDSTSKTLNFYDGAAEKALNPELSKSITIEDPTATEDISIFFTNRAITITEMRAVLVGSATPSVTWTIRHSTTTDRSAAGTEVVTGGTTTTSTTTGSDVTSFNDATIEADEYVWLETTAQSGTVTELHITIFYTVDP